MSNIAACYLLDKETRHRAATLKRRSLNLGPPTIHRGDASMPKCPYNPLISLRPAKNVLSIWGGGRAFCSNENGLFDFSGEF